MNFLEGKSDHVPLRLKIPQWFPNWLQGEIQIPQHSRSFLDNSILPKSPCAKDFTLFSKVPKHLVRLVPLLALLSLYYLWFIFLSPSGDCKLLDNKIHIFIPLCISNTLPECLDIAETWYIFVKWMNANSAVQRIKYLPYCEVSKVAETEYKLRHMCVCYVYMYI